MTLVIKLIPQVGYGKRIWCPTVRIINLTKLTLVLKLDLDIVKMYHPTKNDVSVSRQSKVTARTDRRTDGMKTLPSRTRGR